MYGWIRMVQLGRQGLIRMGQIDSEDGYGWCSSTCADV